jgi:midasin
MDLDGNDEKEQSNEENPDELNLPEDENIELPNEENPENEDDEQIDEQNDKIDSTKNPIPDNLPDQQQDQLEQSALTQDKSSNVDSSNQPNDLQKTFANAETFEEQKPKDQQQNIGESSTKNTSQTQQISSNQQNQLTQQLNNDLQADTNQNKSSNQSNEQRTLSEIASFIDQNIKAAFDLDQTDDNDNINDDLPALENDNTNQQTQIYAHAKNIPKDFPQQKQILDSATEQQAKNLNEQDDLQSTQPEPMIIDNQPEEDKPAPSSSTLQKEPISKTKASSTHQQPSLTSEIDENNQITSIDKPFISTTTVEHQFDYVSQVKPLTNNLTEQIEYQLEEWYTNVNENSNDSNDAEQLWTQLEYLTQPYVFELCEQLRLLLEPTQRTKYSGDYRTGKRLNMKRIIPYIASDFRKDRIWLRRLKPSKRQYQLILAIDDSQSMDNLQVKRLALESLILLGQTLNLLDIGQFGIVSFGQYIQMLQPLNQHFNHENGIQVLKQLKFDQTKTLLADVRIVFQVIRVNHVFFLS